MLKIKNVLNVALCLVLSLLGTSLIFSFVLSMDKVTYQHAFPTAYFLICWFALFGCFIAFWIEQKTKWSL